VTPAPRKTRKGNEIGACNASAAPLLVRSRGGWDPHTLWDRAGFAMGFMGGGGGGARCFFYGPTLPYPTLYHFNLLTFLPSFCTYPSPTLTYRLAIYRVLFFFFFFLNFNFVM